MPTILAQARKIKSAPLILYQMNPAPRSQSAASTEPPDQVADQLRVEASNQNENQKPKLQAHMKTQLETPIQGATAVISHRVEPQNHADYERWLSRIAPVVQSYPGHMDWHVVRPITGHSATYTVILRFDSKAHLTDWIDSTDRRDLIAEAQQFLIRDEVKTGTGFDFWFAAGSKPPPWKQFLVTWSVIFPLVYVTPKLLSPVFSGLHFPESPALHTLVVTGLIVALMVWVIMPRYTRLIAGWFTRS